MVHNNRGLQCIQEAFCTNAHCIVLADQVHIGDLRLMWTAAGVILWTASFFVVVSHSFYFRFAVVVLHFALYCIFCI